MTAPKREKKVELLAIAMTAGSPSLALDRLELQGFTIYQKRKPPASRAESRSRTITASLRKRIIAHIKANPNDMMSEVSQRFNVNQGRISEIKAGMR